MNHVLAIATADVHLSLIPPTARSAELNWLECMDRQWREVKALQRQHSPTMGEPLPVLIAGDIFDDGYKRDGSAVAPELINLAIGMLPDRIYAVYGNHDLPGHNVENLRKSAYMTLVKAGKMIDLKPGKPVEVEGLPTPLRLRGFPYGTELQPLEKHATDAFFIDVAVVHRYCWVKGKGDHPKAKEEDRAKNLLASLAGFDVAVFGDNHIPFAFHQIANCGGFYRRTTLEREHEPSVWLIHTDGTVVRHKLDCSKDLFIDHEATAETVVGGLEGFDEFIGEMNNLSDAAIDFGEALNRGMDESGCDNEVRVFVVGCVEKKK